MPLTLALSGVAGAATGTTGGEPAPDEQPATDKAASAAATANTARMREITTSPKYRPTEPARLVGAEGFEPPPLPCNGSALPLSYAPSSGDRKPEFGCGGRSPVCDSVLP